MSKPRREEAGEAISADTVRHVAAIARLRLSDDEVERLKREAQLILAHFDAVKDTPPGEEEGSTRPAPPFRDDVPRGPDRPSVNEMVETFKKKKDRRLMVPRGL
ncbi:MAG: hypothetical protein HY556_03590 [Euryarchaeota archaeon]|nr:hypothetical protein [Euryarchaeota archaeon]